MPLDSLSVTSQVREMGELMLARRSQEERQLTQARDLVRGYADRWEELAEFAETTKERVAVPTGPLDEAVPVSGRPRVYTAIASDGSEIDPDRHGIGGNYYVINVGSAVIPYGQPGREAALVSESTLGFTDDDLYIVDPGNPRRQVPVRDRHLDARRTVYELGKLAQLSREQRASHPDVPIVALVDGTLLFSVLDERPNDFLREHFYRGFVKHLDTLREADVALAAYASRSRGIDLVALLRARCGVEPETCGTCRPMVLSLDGGDWKDGLFAQPLPPDANLECCLRGMTDPALLEPNLDQWDRSAVFRVRSNVHDPFFGEHRVYFFLLETGAEIGRVEMPEWVARDRAKRDLVHAAMVDQCEKGFGYPTVLARADDRAVISMSDRILLDTAVRSELARRGMKARSSAKLQRKQMRTV